MLEVRPGSKKKKKKNRVSAKSEPNFTGIAKRHVGP